MSEEVRALLFAATQHDRLSRALGAEVGPLLELLAHADHLGFNRGRSEVLESLEDAHRVLPETEPSDVRFNDLGHLDRGEMRPGDVGALVRLLVRAYALGFSRGARETSAGADGARLAVVVDASQHAWRFANELRGELCSPVA